MSIIYVSTPLNNWINTAFQLMHAAGKHKGVHMPATQLLHEFDRLTPRLTKSGPSSLPGSRVKRILKDKDNVKANFIFQDAPNIAALTHEMGHIQHQPTLGISNSIPIVGRIKTLYGEARANIDSWRLLKKIYGDDPELLKLLAKERWKALPYAYSTYLSGAAPSLGSLGGATYSGIKSYNNDKEYWDKRLKIISNDKLTDKQKKDKLSKLKPKSNIAADIIRGAGLGYLAGVGASAAVLPIATAGLKNTLNYGSVSKGTKDIVNKMVDHAKSHGYYKNINNAGAANDSYKYSLTNLREREPFYHAIPQPVNASMSGKPVLYGSAVNGTFGRGEIYIDKPHYTSVIDSIKPKSSIMDKIYGSLGMDPIYI